MFVLKNELFYTVIYSTELNFLKGDRSIYSKQITFFEKQKRFCKNHTHFFINNLFSFQLSFATFEQCWYCSELIYLKSNLNYEMLRTFLILNKIENGRKYQIWHLIKISRMHIFGILSPI